MKLDANGRRRLARYMNELVDNPKLGSMAAVYRLFAQRVNAMGIKPLESETLRTWKEGRRNSIQQESVIQLAALRQEDPRRTQAWLEGVEYQPEAFTVDGEALNIKDPDARVQLANAIAKVASPGELLEYAQTFLDKLGERTGLLVAEKGPESEPSESFYLVGPKVGEPWENIRRSIVIKAAREDVDLTNPQELEAYAGNESIDPKILDSFVNRVELRVSRDHLKQISTLVAEENEALVYAFFESLRPVEV